MDTIHTGDLCRIGFTVRNAEGELQNADSTPTGQLRVNGSDDATSVTVTNVATGHYEASYTADAGWANNATVALTITAIVDGATDKAVIQNAKLRAAVPANVTQNAGVAITSSGGRQEVNTTHWSGTANATPDTAGHPKVTIKSGTGNGEIELGAGHVVNVDAVSTTSNVANIGNGAIGAASFDPDAIDSNVLSDATMTLLNRLDAPVSDAVTAAEAAEAAAESAASAASDINIEPVPTSRTFLMVPQDDDEELVSESAKRIKAGSPGRTYAIDFRQDAAANQKIYNVDALTIESGTEGGVTFGTPGREGTQVKVTITGVTAGDYEVLVTGRYGSGSGPVFRGIINITITD